MDDLVDKSRKDVLGAETYRDMVASRSPLLAVCVGVASLWFVVCSDSIESGEKLIAMANTAQASVSELDSALKKLAAELSLSEQVGAHSPLV